MSWLTDSLECFQYYCNGNFTLYSYEGTTTKWINKYQILSVLHKDISYDKIITLLTFIVGKNLAQRKFSRQFFHCIINSNSSWFSFFDSHEALKERPQTQKSPYNRQHDLGSTTFSVRREAVECLHGFIESFYKSRQKLTQKLFAAL